MKAMDWNVRLPMMRTMGYSRDPRTARSIRAVRHIYIVHYVLSGKGYFNGAPVGEGQGFVMRPGVPAEYHPDEGEPWAFLWFTSSDDAMEYFLGAHGADAETGIFQYQNIREVKTLAAKLSGDTQIMTSSMQIAEYFLHIFNQCVHTVSDSRLSGTDLYYSFAIKYIRENLHLPITVNDICRTTGVTQPYLHKIFKARCGISVKSYISRCRLEMAEGLLCDTALSVTEVGASVGFPNVLAFSRFFSHNEGMSPTEYRKKHRDS